jgi:HK97 family phage prohead protease
MEGLELRQVEATDLRVVQDEHGLQVLRGFAVVFGVLSVNLGGFRERIMPSAIERTIKEKTDLRALIDHDTAKVLGRVTAKTLRLNPDAHGLGVDIEPPNTTYGRDIIESVARGDVSGMSFSFKAVTDDWHMEDDMPIRDVLDMRMQEVSVVTFPAYPQTEVEVARRSAAGGIEAALASLARWRAAAAAAPAPYRPSLALLEARQRQARG